MTQVTTRQAQVVRGIVLLLTIGGTVAGVSPVIGFMFVLVTSCAWLDVLDHGFHPLARREGNVDG